VSHASPTLTIAAGLPTGRVLAVALKFGLLTFLFAVLAAVFSVGTILRDDAQAAWVSAFCLSHVNLLVPAY
jgi:hypothetical protein